jgi:hypothetical protein
MSELGIDRWHTTDIHNGDLRATASDAMSSAPSGYWARCELIEPINGITTTRLLIGSGASRVPLTRSAKRGSSLLGGLVLAGLEGMPNRNVP